MEREVPRRLRVQWGVWVGLGVLAWALACFGWLAAYGPEAAARWAGPSALVWLLWAGLSHRWLAENRSPRVPRVRPAMGPANGVTLFRGWLVAALWGMVALPDALFGAWMPVAAGLFALGVALDFLDGLVARVMGHASLLGQRLDVAVDGMAVLGGVFLAVRGDRVPVWYLLVGLAYYLFLLGQKWRRARGLPVYPLPPSMVRRALAGVQMGFLVLAMAPWFPAEATRWAAWVFGLPFLGNFLWDWATVSGRNRGFAARLQRVRAWLPRLALVLRVGAGGGVLLWALGRFWGNPNPQAALGLAVGLAVLAGMAPRAAAAAGMALLGFWAAEGHPWGAAERVLLALLGGVFHLGGGPLVLWTPEERLLQRPLGGKAGSR